MNYRDKIISDNIALCLRHKDLLTDWERNFVESVDGQDYPLTQNQFNRLNEIATKVNRKLLIG